MRNFHEFNIKQLEMRDYYFIAHRLDRVLLGREGEPAHRLLLEAIEQGTLLEAHFFDGEKEIFVVRAGEHLVAYEPLLHEATKEEDCISRSYRLEDKFLAPDGGYNLLAVKEYVNYDKLSQLAYVEKTVLYKLERRVE